MHACDAYVSLHRAEGFGLTVPEAMALGKPVISTAYSGTLETTTPANAWLVPYRLVHVGEGSPPYPPDARWAEPDITHAARAMREVFENPAEAKKRGDRAASDMASRHNAATRVPFVAARLAALDAQAARRQAEAAREAAAAPPTAGDVARRALRDCPNRRSRTSGASANARWPSCGQSASVNARHTRARRRLRSTRMPAEGSNRSARSSDPCASRPTR